jgi:magnesium transporter
VVTVFVHRDGRTQCVPALDPSLLAPGSDAKVWVDLAAATESEFRILSDVFHFHALAVEDAVASLHHPKIEAYDGYLYLILHGIDYQQSRDKESFITHDTDFFLGPNYLVTIHDGQGRSINGIQEVCGRNDHVLGEGPGALMHRIIDRMVDNYRPEIEQLETWLDELEREVFGTPKKETVREILSVKQDVTALRRISTPQRDAIGRLARREFPMIPEELTYRFRDVYDNLVRIADEGLIFQDRITSLLDAHYSSVSNRLNEIMRVLTVITVIVSPLTLVAGIYGMNMKLPLVGSESDPRPFWWLVGGMVATVVVMLGFFRKKHWL